jgi:hypothetical protein
VKVDIADGAAAPCAMVGEIAGYTFLGRLMKTRPALEFFKKCLVDTSDIKNRELAKILLGRNAARAM